MGMGSCLVLERTSLDHEDIPTGFVRGSATGKVKSALSGLMVHEQKVCKKLYAFVCHFCQ